MSLVVVGSIGIDNIETPTAKKENLLGGSAVYFAYAAGFFTKVEMVGVVGKDFPAEYRVLMQKNNVDLAGLEVADGQMLLTPR